MTKVKNKVFVAIEDLSYTINQDIRIIKADTQVPDDITPQAIKELIDRGLVKEFEYSA